MNPISSKKKSRIRGFFRRYFACCSPTDCETKKRRISSIHSSAEGMRSPPQNADGCRGMSVQERDENIKEAILYCKSSSSGSEAEERK
ncbi:hypothetical protein Tsubulata_033408 [Turnera subulata]|uniref:Uncharacterized protein n=1 Tax=Turnera subulata TaxID=218843 RepID=A0A9Q0JL01_9ROSI|nr:hypothetical protein Tsubulata_033408 [Turnera subulata]